MSDFENFGSLRTAVSNRETLLCEGYQPTSLAMRLNSAKIASALKAIKTSSDEEQTEATNFLGAMCARLFSEGFFEQALYIRETLFDLKRTIVEQSEIHDEAC